MRNEERPDADANIAALRSSTTEPGLLDAISRLESDVARLKAELYLARRVVKAARPVLTRYQAFSIVGPHKARERADLERVALARCLKDCAEFEALSRR